MVNGLSAIVYGNDSETNITNKSLPLDEQAMNIRVSPKKRKRRKKNKKQNVEALNNNDNGGLLEVDAEVDADVDTEVRGEAKKINKKIKFDLDNNVEPKKRNIDKVDQNNGIVSSSEMINKYRKDSVNNETNFLRKISNHVRAAPKNVEFFSDEEDDEDDIDDRSTQQFSRKSIDDLKRRAQDLLSIRETLPVYKVKNSLIPRLLQNKVTVLIGETGSGKSTQIPQFLMEHCSKKKGIAVTQPRRVAAINLATRVAEEYGCLTGDEVGYSVRFQHLSNSKTKLKYLTDGMLLRELMLDKKLSQYDTIIIDEAHERTILTDLLLGFLKKLLEERSNDNFKIIIMSATINAEYFADFFGGCEILYVEGKMYPVEQFYLPKSTEDIVDTMAKSIIQLNLSESEGDILAFLPGQEDIDKTVATLNKLAPDLPKIAPYIIALPLYAALPSSQQVKIFQPVKKNQRKVIVATNIAETSITIPGIKYVIDSGLRKIKAWKHELGLSTLLTAPISQASATQRSGRAGRESSGKCFRLYTEKDYFKLPEQTDAEIVRSDIISPVLILKKMRVNNLFDWPWLEHPGEKPLSSAMFQLLSLGALDYNTGEITELGEKMAVLPLQPHLSAVLITANSYGVLSPVIDIVSCLSVDNLILTPSNERRDEVNERRRNACPLASRYGDLIMLKELFDIYLSINDTQERKKWCKELDISFKNFKNVLRVRKQLREYMKTLHLKEKNLFENEEENTPLDIKSTLKSFLKGFITNTAIGMPDRSYRTVVGGNLISVHPSSMIFGQKNDAIMYIEYVFTTKGYGRNVSVIELDWLQEISPNLLGTRISVN